MKYSFVGLIATVLCGAQSLGASVSTYHSRLFWLSGAFAFIALYSLGVSLLMVSKRANVGSEIFRFTTIAIALSMTACRSSKTEPQIFIQRTDSTQWWCVAAAVPVGEPCTEENWIKSKQWWDRKRTKEAADGRQ